MHKKFEINWTKIKGGRQSGRKVVTHNSKSDLPLNAIFTRYGICSTNWHDNNSHNKISNGKTHDEHV